MNRKLLSELTKMKGYEFRLLEHHLWIARQVRDTMSKNAISEKDMATHLGVSPRSMKSVINGSYPFDLRLLASLESLQQQIASNNAKLKVEAESIGFTTYKYQYPMYVEKIEKLIKILEEKNDPKPH